MIGNSTSRQRSRALTAKLMLRFDIAAIPGGGIGRRLGKILVNRFFAPREKVVLQVQHGLAEGLWLDLNPRTDNHYYMGGAEQALQEALRDQLQPGMVVYDVGANVGFFTLLMQRLVGDSGEVYAFEPDAEVVCELRRNVECNGCENVSVVGAAVWSSTGSVGFVRADPLQSPNRGTGSVRANVTEDCVSSRSTSLDEFMNDASPPDLIKCDVEGGEVEVLRGACALLAEYRPVVLVEVHSTGKGREVARILESFEYALESIDPTHLLATPRPRAAPK